MAALIKMTRNLRTMLTAVAAQLFVTNAPAAETTFQAGPARVALVELYTSEGCSSCPPAEKWIAGLREHAELWRSFVPVALHVNYWDHLGWRDALASKAFTARQHAYAATWRADSVYTPCFVRDGAEWRPSERENFAAAGRGAPAEAGTLRLIWREDRTCRVEFSPAPAPGERVSGATERSAATPLEFDATIALLGGGIVSAVKAGENRGRELRHEFVALALETVRLRRGDDGGFTGEVKLPAGPALTPKPARHALAGWVAPRGSLAPVQAAGGWLP